MGRFTVLDADRNDCTMFYDLPTGLSGHFNYKSTDVLHYYLNHLAPKPTLSREAEQYDYDKREFAMRTTRYFVGVDAICEVATGFADYLEAGTYNAQLKTSLIKQAAESYEVERKKAQAIIMASNAAKAAELEALARVGVDITQMDATNADEWDSNIYAPKFAQPQRPADIPALTFSKPIGVLDDTPYVSPYNPRYQATKEIRVLQDSMYQWRLDNGKLSPEDVKERRRLIAAAEVRIDRLQDMQALDFGHPSEPKNEEEYEAWASLDI